MKPLTMALELHSSKKNHLGKMELVSVNARLFSTNEFQLSTIFQRMFCKNLCTLRIEFLIQGSQHRIILYTDHKPILFLAHKRTNQITECKNFS